MHPVYITCRHICVLYIWAHQGPWAYSIVGVKGHQSQLLKASDWTSEFYNDDDDDDDDDDDEEEEEEEDDDEDDYDYYYYDYYYHYDAVRAGDSALLWGNSSMETAQCLQKLLLYRCVSIYSTKEPQKAQRSPKLSPKYARQRPHPCNVPWLTRHEGYLINLSLHWFRPLANYSPKVIAITTGSLLSSKLEMVPQCLTVPSIVLSGGIGEPHLLLVKIVHCHLQLKMSLAASVHCIIASRSSRFSRFCDGTFFPYASRANFSYSCFALCWIVGPHGTLGQLITMSVSIFAKRYEKWWHVPSPLPSLFSTYVTCLFHSMSCRVKCFKHLSEAKQKLALANPCDIGLYHSWSISLIDIHCVLLPYDGNILPYGTMRIVSIFQRRPPLFIFDQRAVPSAETGRQLWRLPLFQGSCQDATIGEAISIPNSAHYIQECQQVDFFAWDSSNIWLVFHLLLRFCFKSTRRWVETRRNGAPSSCALWARVSSSSRVAVTPTVGENQPRTKSGKMDKNDPESKESERIRKS